MTTLTNGTKMDKKFFTKPSGNHSSGSTHNRPVRNFSFSNGQSGNSLSVEILEVREGTDNTPIVGGPYVCLLEVIDPSSIQQILWKQKSSAQFTSKPPIIFGDIFKVKSLSGEWCIDIRPGFTLKIQLCKVSEKALTPLDSATIELQDLVVNKEQQKVIPLEVGKAEVVLRMTLSNAQYPRVNALTLREIDQKEKEKGEKTQEQNEPSIHEEKSLQQALSYSLPRVKVRFCIHYHTNPGEDLRVVGSNYKLGDWDPFKAGILEWTNGDFWVLEISFRKAFIPFEYKYIVCNNHNGVVRWENIKNRKVEVTESEFIDRSEVWEKL